jgi:hypothetical protein
VTKRIKKTAKERASFSSPNIFTVIQPKRLRELMHVEHRGKLHAKFCLENFTKKGYLGNQGRDRHTEMIQMLGKQVVLYEPN